jgi:hypothetical protein
MTKEQYLNSIKVFKDNGQYNDERTKTTISKVAASKIYNNFLHRNNISATPQNYIHNQPNTTPNVLLLIAVIAGYLILTRK